MPAAEEGRADAGHDAETRDYLGEVVRIAAEVAGANLAAAWAVGSLVTGDFDPRRSDLDLILVANRPLGESAKDDLARRLSHGCLPCPAHGLDVVLYSAPQLAALDRGPDYDFSLTTGPEWQDDVGRGGPYPGGILDLALARTFGLTVSGSRPEELMEPIADIRVRRELVRGIAWHREHVHDPFHDPTGSNAVLNTCRTARYFATGEFVSKTEGAQWVLDRDGIPVVEAALAGRRGTRSDPLDRGAVVSFLDQVLDAVETPGSAGA